MAAVSTCRCRRVLATTLYPRSLACVRGVAVREGARLQSLIRGPGDGEFHAATGATKFDGSACFPRLAKAKSAGSKAGFVANPLRRTQVLLIEIFDLLAPQSGADLLRQRLKYSTARFQSARTVLSSSDLSARAAFTSPLRALTPSASIYDTEAKYKDPCDALRRGAVALLPIRRLFRLFSPATGCDHLAIFNFPGKSK